MSATTDWISALSSMIGAIATTVAAGGVVFAYKQLVSAKQIAQLQFEDGLAKEYRELAGRLPTVALLGGELTGAAYEDAFDELFHYIDLSNEQVRLRQAGRISAAVWRSWRDGIRSNLELPAFKRAWLEVQGKSSSFLELRRLQQDFDADPSTWESETLER